MPPVLNPSLLQINSRIWRTELSQTLGQPATLDQVPDSVLDRIAERGFDWVWLMGVWRTGAASREVSRTNPQWHAEYQELLPDLEPEDIAGSPYAICQYAVMPELGGDAALLRFRERLAERKIRLMLDFVPNHTALDHPWVEEHPEWYVAGSSDDLQQQPQNYRRAGSAKGEELILAHGRDPYFPGWPDTFQLNYRHGELREAMTRVLIALADRCDGVRCDMAMLLLPEIIERTWGERSLPRDGTPPVDKSFWLDAVPRVRRRHPNFVFLAEVYWDLEWELQQQGFDYTYDKRLYDRLAEQNAGEVNGHLNADADFQRHSARFLENHDEPRAAAVFPTEVQKAAAMVAFFVPGLRFFHEGQFEGRCKRASNHLSRRMEEPVDVGVCDFYRQMLTALDDPIFKCGHWWHLNPTPAWEGNTTHEHFVVSLWQLFPERVPKPSGERALGEKESDQRRIPSPPTDRVLVVVNYGPTQAQCYVRLPLEDRPGQTITLHDEMSTAEYVRDHNEMRERGLYLDLPPWGYHLFRLRSRDVPMASEMVLGMAQPVE